MAIIPRPLQHDATPGDLRLDAPLAVVFVGVSEGQQAALDEHADAIEEALRRAGIESGAEATRMLAFEFDDDAGPEGSDNPERYTLRVTPDAVRIAAPTAAGLWYGTVSLTQLVRRGKDGVGVMPCGVVVDEPRYSWRGQSLDVARHFFGPEDLRRVVDLLARYKMNRLHLHLTDDQGWRIESPSRPELTQLSASDDCSHGPGGFLTVAEFRDLDAYAAERFVTLVPEIDVPSHTNAATHAYGNLRPDGVATDIYHGIDVGFSTLTYGLASTEPFLRDVFGDLAAITSGPYLHFGGDEAHSTDKRDYVRFIELSERIVRETGKIPVAWNEAAAAPLSAGTLVQYWDTNNPNPDALCRAAEGGARIIMSPARNIYLDMKYTADYPFGQDWAGLVELRDSYDWDPQDVVPGLEPAAIEGVESGMWTETLARMDDVIDMLLPRLTAVAEVAWTAPERKDWADFTGRVAIEAAREWVPGGVPFHRTPQVDWER